MKPNSQTSSANSDDTELPPSSLASMTVIDQEAEEISEVALNSSQILEKILKRKVDIQSINKSLLAIIDSIFADASFLTRTAHYWGELPFVERMAIGVAVSGGLFLVGALAHFGLVLTMSVFAGVSYFGGNFILEDHYQTMLRAKERLKEAIMPLAQMLENVILLLDKEISQFSVENEKLRNSVKELNSQVESFKLTCASMGITSISMETTAQELATQMKALEEANAQLQQREKALLEVKEVLEKENQQVKLICTTLQSTVGELSQTVLTGEEQRKEFQNKLERFVTDKSASFDSLSQRIFAAEKELEVVRLELNNCNQRYDELLKSHSGLLEQHTELLKTQNEQIGRLETMNSSGEKPPASQTDKVIKRSTSHTFLPPPKSIERADALTSTLTTVSTFQ